MLVCKPPPNASLAFNLSNDQAEAIDPKQLHDISLSISELSHLSSKYVA